MSYYIQGKGWFESNGSYIGSKRKIALEQAKVCGFQNDKATFTRLCVESRCSFQALNEAWRKGAAMRQGNQLPA